MGRSEKLPVSRIKKTNGNFSWPGEDSRDTPPPQGAAIPPPAGLGRGYSPPPPMFGGPPFGDDGGSEYGGPQEPDDQQPPAAFGEEDQFAMPPPPAPSMGPPRPSITDMMKNPSKVVLCKVRRRVYSTFWKGGGGCILILLFWNFLFNVEIVIDFNSRVKRNLGQ